MSAHRVAVAAWAGAWLTGHAATWPWAWPPKRSAVDRRGAVRTTLNRVSIKRRPWSASLDSARRSTRTENVRDAGERGVPPRPRGLRGKALFNIISRCGVRDWPYSQPTWNLKLARTHMHTYPARNSRRKHACAGRVAHATALPSGPMQTRIDANTSAEVANTSACMINELCR